MLSPVQSRGDSRLSQWCYRLIRPFARSDLPLRGERGTIINCNAGGARGVRFAITLEAVAQGLPVQAAGAHVVAEALPS
jgi:hypothetical protein